MPQAPAANRNAPMLHAWPNTPCRPLVAEYTALCHIYLDPLLWSHCVRVYMCVSVLALVCVYMHISVLVLEIFIMLADCKINSRALLTNSTFNTCARLWSATCWTQWCRGLY